MLPTKYASFFKRWIAHIIDVIIASFLGGILLIPLVLATAGTGIIDQLRDHGWHWDMCAVPHSMMGMWTDQWAGPFAAFSVTLIVLWLLIHTVLYWLYFAAFESSPRQATPGKMMLGLFVTDELGRRISFPRALGRTVGKVLSQMFCWLGYLLALFTSRQQALHDLLANTLVLEPAYPAPYAGQAPPQATPPGYPPPPPAGPAGAAAPEPPAAEVPFAGQESLDLSGVEVPETSDPPAVDTEQEKGMDLEIEKPGEDSTGDDKPEQEKE